MNNHEVKKVNAFFNFLKLLYEVNLVQGILSLITQNMYERVEYTKGI